MISNMLFVFNCTNLNRFKMKKNNKIKLELTKLEMIALTDLIDTYSALSESISDDGQARKDLRKVDSMLKKNGFKRIYS